MRLPAFLAAMFGIAAICAAAQNPPEIQVWPRAATVVWPADCEQFMFLELPRLTDGKFTVKIVLPDQVTATGFFSGRSPAVPPPDSSMIPESWKQDGNTVTINAPAGLSGNQVWLCTSIKVAAKQGSHAMTVEITDDAGKTLQKREFPVEVDAPLIGKTSKNLSIAVWYYAGLDPAYVERFVDQFQAAGVNAFYAMDGELVNGKVPATTVFDVAAARGLETGVVYFSGWVLKYAQQQNLIPAEQGLQYLLDHPDLFKQAFKAYIDHTTAGKEFQVIIYDAEAGCIRRDHIEGDLTAYGLEKFSKEIGSEKVLTPEQIFKDHAEQWMWFNCRQSNEIAKLSREAIDEFYPSRLFMVYSGYEYDDDYKDLTRRNYSIDWKSMGDNFLDYAGAGYYGSADQIRHTFEVLEGRATFVPADMYLENFLSHQSAPTVGQWKMRLIRTFMNSGMRGVSLWYSAVMDGAALEAVSEFTRFALLVEDFAIRGHLDSNAITVSPRTEADNVYVIRDSKQAKVVLLNNSDAAKTFSLTLNDFKIKGYTSDIQITDIVSGEKFPAQRTIRIKVPPMGYRVIHILDDGN
ncbi:MAG: hypothetical protein AB7F40_01970 [Victivallaceae bacterium]|nr:hypothetical protein [Victivallaceae bacterium]